MVFRLPTHLDNFIPPPSSQLPAAPPRPWRGTLIVSGMRASDMGSNQEILVTAVETDGDSDVIHWPTQFFAHLTHGRPILREVRAWIRQHRPPISTFMPDRQRDPNTNVVNQTTFRSLSRILFENQIVAIAPWGTDHFTGGGIIIIPAEHSSALLIAALFFSQFPEIITARSNITPTPLVTQQLHHSYTQPISAMSSMSPRSSGSRQVPSPLSLRRLQGSVSPVEQPISRSRHEQHRSMILQEAPPVASSSSWPPRDDDGRREYSSYPPPPGPHSRYPPPPPST